VVRKILRAEINLFGNRYFNSELATRHSDELQIGYDIHDAQWVWVYDEDGRFLCKAEFNGNSRDYFPKPIIEQARDRRAAGRRKRAEKTLEEIEAERNGGLALEALPINEIPGMRAAAQRVENRPVEMAATIPTSDQPRERFNFWRELDQRVNAGEDIPEGLRPFYIAYPKSADGRSWLRTYAADDQHSGAL
jgi:putative transposase